MIPQYSTLKSNLPKYRLKKSSIPQYRKPPFPPPCCWRGDRKFGLKTSNYILVNIIIATIKLSSFNVKMLKDMYGYFKISYKSRDLKISWRPFSQGFRTCKGMWMQQKIISFCNFTVRELECLVCCPLLYDKLCVVHWLLPKCRKHIIVETNCEAFYKWSCKMSEALSSI